MEEKRRDAGTLPSFAGGDSEQPSSRRRAGGNKRKANNLSSPAASSAPSKRFTRDKGFNSYPPIHNGPLTRARQGPGSLSVSGIGGASGSPVTSAKTEAAARSVDGIATEELSRASREWEALEASIEAEVEAVRSRDLNSHVVPCHCGWFSWTKPHQIEELTLPSFFDGKSSTRTSDMYLEIRNWIMKKFHADPNTPIELKDLSELEVGDLDARQEVMEFLDYWGLINFHPVLRKDSTPANADSHKEEEEKDASLEKLYHFEVQQLRPPVLLKANTTTPAMAAGLFPESTIAEELAGPEGPSVEYHCNSCSADCSRKRYHCQKQADFDLCSDCFSDGKFDSNMSSSDFILMEPAELPGANGGNWTDQETLLLLEALELYKENWNEIAEHVATKTKTQCILHFVQMPIEDSFLDYDEDRDANSKEPADTAIANTDSSTPKDVPEATELKTGDAEGQSEASLMETSKPEDINEVKADQETSKPDEGSEVKSCPETLKQEDTKEVKIVEDTGENCAVKALRDAFEAIGYPTPEGPLSFADVGNPVMALAAYLTRLVDPDIATASVHGSLKSISGNASGMELAARHCFLLEGPPDYKKEPGGCGSDATGMVDKDAQNKYDEDLVQEKKEPSNNDESNAAKVADVTGKQEDGSCNLLESNKSKTVKDQPPSSSKKSDDSEDQTPAGDHSHSTEAPNDVDTVSNSFPSDKSVAPPPSESTNVGPTMVSKADVDMTSETLPSLKNESQQHVASEPMGEPSKSTEALEDVDIMSCSLPSAKTDIQQSVTANSIVENKPNEKKEEKSENKGDDKGKSDDKEEKSDSVQEKDDQDIDKLKRAAVTALSAAAVKAKFLANQEEEQIKELAASLIEKLLRKLETKLGFFSEMENVMVRVREQMDRSRQRLFQERAQIIAARLGLPASSSRAMPPSLPTNRIATNFANSGPRPPMMTMTAQRPPFSRPMGAMGPTPSNPLVSTSVAGGSIRPSSQDNVGLK